MISKRGKSNTPIGIASHAHVLLARYTILHPGGGGGRDTEGKFV